MPFGADKLRDGTRSHHTSRNRRDSVALLHHQDFFVLEKDEKSADAESGMFVHGFGFTLFVAVCRFSAPLTYET